VTNVCVLCVRVPVRRKQGVSLLRHALFNFLFSLFSFFRRTCEESFLRQVLSDFLFLVLFLFFYFRRRRGESSLRHVLIKA
jgi:hypothetical protein